LDEEKKDHINLEGKKPQKENLVEVVWEEAEPEKSIAPKDEENREPAEVQQETIPLETIQEQLLTKTREASENFDKWLRLRAEFDNFKKRMQKEKAELLKFGNESLLKSLLPILDNLELAIDHGKDRKDSASLMEGVELILKQFLNTMEKFGVKPISVQGEVFDPEKHEAVSQAESDLGPNRVISEIQRGYFFHDRLLRPAKVVVSKERPEAKAEGN